MSVNGIVDALNQDYVQPSDGSTAASDQAQNFGAVAAELTYMEPVLGNPTDDSYKVSHLR